MSRKTMKKRMKTSAFFRNYTRLIVGGLIMAVVIFCAIFAPVLTSYDPQVLDLTNAGYTPVLAHVERYQCMLAKPANVKDLHDLGVKIQVNADSVAGAFGFKIKHFIKKLLKEQVIDFIGSDAHDEKRRTPAIAKCAEVLHKYCDEQYADDLLFGNAAREFFGSE